MATAPEKLLAMRAGQTTVGENLERAIQSGNLIEQEDGKLCLASPQARSNVWVFVDNGPPLDCTFLMDFMFRQAYAEAAVPHGCQACYKVKVVLKTLRELVAAWQAAERIQCRSKWGLDFYNPYSQSVYAGYFYTTGLDHARAVFKAARKAFDADPKLGPSVEMTIKRGCSNYEALLGPSDEYQFTLEMAELESDLKGRFQQPRKSTQRCLALAHWIDLAFRLADNTYLDFTDGRRRRVKTLTYPLEGS
jgi:hypothetical protein